MLAILVGETLVLALVTVAAARRARTAPEGWLVRGDAWWALDKGEHLALGFIVLVVLAVPLWRQPVSLGWQTVNVLWAVETWQLVRFGTWIARGRPAPWPWETDGISWKDLVAGVAGALLGAGALWRICLG